MLGDADLGGNAEGAPDLSCAYSTLFNLILEKIRRSLVFLRAHRLDMFVFGVDASCLPITLAWFHATRGRKLGPFHCIDVSTSRA